MVGAAALEVTVTTPHAWPPPLVVSRRQLTDMDNFEKLYLEERAKVTAMYCEGRVVRSSIRRDIVGRPTRRSGNLCRRKWRRR